MSASTSVDPSYRLSPSNLLRPGPGYSTSTSGYSKPVPEPPVVEVKAEFHLKPWIVLAAIFAIIKWLRR